MPTLDDIYRLMKIFYMELDEEKKKNRIQKIREKTENILFPFSLAILASYYILIEYIDRFDPPSFLLHGYELKVVHLVFFLLGMTLLFILGKVFTVTLRLVTESENIAKIDEVYLPLFFVLSISGLVIAAVMFVFSVIFKQNFFIPSMYVLTILAFVAISYKLFPLLKSQFKASRVYAMVSRPPFMIVTASGSPSSFFIRNGSDKALKKEDIEIEPSDLKNFRIQMEKVKKINENKFRPIKDIDPKRSVVVPFKIEKMTTGKTEEELLEIVIRNKKTNYEISRLTISLI